MTTQKSLKVKAGLITASLHLGVVCSISLFGFVPPPVAEPLIVEAAIVEMAKLGDVLPDPKALVRIEPQAAMTPEPETAISLSRRVEPKPVEKKPKKKLKKKPKQKPKKKPKQKPKKKPKKKLRDLSSLIDDEIEDERADVEDRKIGFKAGHAQGRSQNPDALKLTYAFELSAALRPHLKVPEVIPNRIHSTLQTKVHFKVSSKGKVIGKPKIIKSSGQQLFDHAALNAINYFGPGKPGRLPLPKDKAYLRQIMKHGITTNMRPTL